METESMNNDTSIKRVVILVHGIRTFGAWQDRLASILRQEIHGIEVHVYKFGFFSSIAFLIPFLRTPVIRRFRTYLINYGQRWEQSRIDVVAHSFGTYVTAWALRGLNHDQIPRINTLIFCGSVLKQLFPWGYLVGKGMPIKRVINDCGLKDAWPRRAQLVSFGMGMAGRRGFAGVTGPDVGIINRYFSIGHSDFFTDDFMRRHWLPLLTTSIYETGSEVIPPTPRWWAEMENLADPIKLAMLVLLVVLPIIFFLKIEIEKRDLTISLTQKEAERILALERANSEEKLKIEEQKRRKTETALKLIEESRNMLFRFPEKAFFTAVKANDIQDTDIGKDVLKDALRLIIARRQIQINDLSN